MYCGYYYNYTCILLVMYLKFYKLDVNIYCTLFLQFGAYLTFHQPTKHLHGIMVFFSPEISVYLVHVLSNYYLLLEN